jgi:hypothetical protein
MNNGRRYQERIKIRAMKLRKQGWTHREIVRKLGASLGAVWSWTKKIVLTPEQKKAIEERKNKYVWTIERRAARSRLARKNFALYWKKPYSKRELIKKIRRFYLRNGRIPLKREFNMYREYQQRFGGWNKAIQLAGFATNPVIFSTKHIARDGHTCDSYAEKIIDDWLFGHQISHIKNYLYEGTKMTADFAIGNIRLEYFGLAGESKLYDRTIQSKREFCKKENLRLIEVYPSDLFPNRLSKIVSLGELKSVISS